MAASLQLAPGDRVRAHAGRVWLTEPGDAADHFVGAGQCHLLRHGGRVVLECDGACAARVRLEPACRARRGSLPIATRRGLPQVALAFGLGLRRLRCWLGRLADPRQRQRQGET